MPSTFETILGAIIVALSDALSAEVLRDQPLPDAIGADGMVILREGDPGEPFVVMSPLSYTFDHQLTLEVMVQGGSGRDAAFDAIKVAIGGVFAADRTLGGLCEWVEMGPPEASDEPFYGADPVKMGVIPLTITYTTSNPLD